MGTTYSQIPGAEYSDEQAISAVETVALVLASQLTVNAGIKFPAIAVPDADVNVLDDIEEGTWTPVLTFATPGDESIIQSHAIGKYAKSGRLVAVNFTMATSTFTHTTASGALHMTGLPFTSQNLTSDDNRGALMMGGVTKSDIMAITVQLGPNNNIATFQAMISGAAIAVISAADMPTGGDVRVHGNLVYMASS